MINSGFKPAVLNLAASYTGADKKEMLQDYYRNLSGHAGKGSLQNHAWSSLSGIIE